MSLGMSLGLNFGLNFDLSLGMKPAERHIEIPHHLTERGDERGPPPNEHVVETRAHPAGCRNRRHPHDLPQATAHPITLHGIAYLFRNGEADPDGTLIAARARLQHEAAAGRPRPVRHGPKIAPAFQPFNDDGTGVAITH
jgi:hypothetical protein